MSLTQASQGGNLARPERGMSSLARQCVRASKVEVCSDHSPEVIISNCIKYITWKRLRAEKHNDGTLQEDMF